MDDEQNEYERRKGVAQASRWRRVKEWTVPEQTWLAELTREAEPLLGSNFRRYWLSALNSPRTHTRQQARLNVRALPSAARCLLTVTAYRHAVNLTSTIVAVSVLVAVTLSAVGLGIGGSIGLAWALLLILCIAGAAVDFVHANRAQELAQNLIDESNDVRLIPFLLMRLQPARSNHTQRQIFAGRVMRNALLRLLPLAEEADTAEWTGAHWNAMLYSLRCPYSDLELTLAVLQTVARVGNEAAQRAVNGLLPIGTNVQERLYIGHERAAWESSRSRIEQAAQECLPRLEARLERHRYALTLLRAADINTASSGDILLRPASNSGGETPAEQLLRPQNEA